MRVDYNIPAPGGGIPPSQNQLPQDLIEKIRAKAKWLRAEDRIKLCERYACTEGTLSRHINGVTKKINFRLIADALDMANKNEQLINSRL